MKNIKVSLLAAVLCCGGLMMSSQKVAAATPNNSKNVATKKTVQATPSQNGEKKEAQTSSQEQVNQKHWEVRQGKSYYLVNNKPLKGLRKIDKATYLFDKNGVMLTGLRKIPRKSSYGYFGVDGKRQFANTNTGKAYYWINKSGSVTGIKNTAKTISQRPQMPTGCEITAVTMMINFAGKNITKEQAAKIMPRSYNPNKGFIGSPYKNFPLGFWVAPNGVKPVVQHYLGTSVNMTNCSMAAIKRKLIRSHLVVAWVGWFDGFSNHAIALTGYHGNTLYYNDPWTGTQRSMSVGTFKHHWAQDGHRALSY